MRGATLRLAPGLDEGALALGQGVCWDEEYRSPGADVA